MTATWTSSPARRSASSVSNGAGKSTTINMLCTLVTPSAGSASVAGYDVVADRLDVRRSIGLVFQDTTLDNYRTAAE